MKRIAAILSVLALFTLSIPALAHDHSAAAKTATRSVTGEVVDMGCYLEHAAHGEKHVSCAAKCLSQGMPMGLLTSSGTLYLVTLSHDDADPYNNLKTMAGKNVTVTGPVMNRNGMSAIEATKIQVASK
jgi:hypothetical protein